MFISGENDIGLAKIRVHTLSAKVTFPFFLIVHGWIK